MKKRILGSLLLVACIVAATIGLTARSVNAANVVNSYTGLKVITNTTEGKVLKAGDSYKVQVTVSVEKIANLVSTQLYYKNLQFCGYKDWEYIYDATSTVYDETNKCYVITLESTIKDEKPGIWNLFGVIMEDKDGNAYCAYFDENEKLTHTHYVVDEGMTDSILLSDYAIELKIGEKVQMKALKLPDLEVTTAEWSSERKTVATIDEAGVITGQSAGITYLHAMYNDKEYVFRVTVEDNKGDAVAADSSKRHILNNKVTLVSNSASGKNLVKGDSYTLVFSVEDTDINNATTGSLSINGLDGVVEVTSVEHDQINHCYIVTYEGIVNDEKDKSYNFNNLVLENDLDERYIFLRQDGYDNSTIVVNNATAPTVESEKESETAELEANATVSATDEETQIAASDTNNNTPDTGDTLPIGYMLAAGLSIIAISAAIWGKKNTKLNIK